MRPPWPCGTSARLLYQICLAEAWRQDVVVDASSGVVYNSPHTSHTRKTAGGFLRCLLVSYTARWRSQPSHFFRRCVTRRKTRRQ